MMIGPESYYEIYLKDKTADEILSTIRGLKNEIGRLKNIAEHPEYQCTVHPSEKVRIVCTRAYLERAKQALTDMGVEYNLSKTELKVTEFDENISNIRKITLSIGGCFYGDDVYEVVIGEKEIEFKSAHFDIPALLTDLGYRTFCDREEFIELFRRLHIGEWRKNYNTRRFGYSVCDGTQWSLEIHYSNGLKPVKIYGDNAYPYNFDDFKELMGCDRTDF